MNISQAHKAYHAAREIAGDDFEVLPFDRFDLTFCFMMDKVLICARGVDDILATADNPEELAQAINDLIARGIA